MSQTNALYNRQQMRRYNWIKNYLEDRLLSRTLSGEIKTGSDKWRAYCILIEKADIMVHNYFLKHIENI